MGETLVSKRLTRHVDFKKKIELDPTMLATGEAHQVIQP